MTRIGARALLLSGAFIVMIAAGSTLLISFDSAGVRGIAIGVAAGIVNLVVGLKITRRTLEKNMMTVTATSLGGFTVRMVLLIVLYFVFKQTSTIDAAAFALSFVVLFFVYLIAEIVMIERSRTSRTA